MAQKKQNIIQAIKEYGRQLFGFIRGRVNSNEDAEDILQDVWYQLSSQAKFEDIESVSGWLYRVARNKITDTYRKRKTETLNVTGADEESDEWMAPAFIVTDSNDPETKQLEKLFRESLFEALQELPENQRNVFIWNELEEITLQEIADREKENIKTIISRKRYAVQHLRKRLESLYNDFLNY
ncbi:MAG: sigma-70 family RNA polymerase sigma factor [Sphingobacteriales bacterium]|nr:sigma-70 family RNA polymerase sigma factor [Sphingobacteriales bacterium]